jgi:hypothetical protein
MKSNLSLNTFCTSRDIFGIYIFTLRFFLLSGAVMSVEWKLLLLLNHSAYNAEQPGSTVYFGHSEILP